MARGQTTEAELATGLKTIGRLGPLKDRPKLRRDSPFANSDPAPSTAPNGPSIAPDQTETQPSPQVGRPMHAASAEDAAPPHRTVYTDEITLPMTADMRSRTVILAAELQRRRTVTGPRFSPNVIFRAAISAFLDRFDPDEVGPINSEQELLAVANKLLAGTGEQR